MSMISKILMVAVAGVALQACGGGGGGAANTSKFVGIWHPTSGTFTFTCPSGNDTVAVTDNLTWAKGVTSDLVSTDSSNCIINAKITASTASGSGPACTIIDSGLTEMLTVTAYTFSLSADGQTATESGMGTVVVSGGGSTETCQVSLSAIYMKISS
jgi:ABC-type glycerol-3-phosphate transport system substrate-binding protein